MALHLSVSVYNESLLEYVMSALSSSVHESVKPSIPLIPLWDGFRYFDHQVDGIRWMLDKELCGTLVEAKKPSDLPVLVRGGFQCDEMGLGKTIQVVATMIHHPLPLTILLVPVAMIDTWTSICQRVGFPIYHAVAHDWVPLASNSRVLPTRSSSIVYITNYEKLYTTPRLFRGLSAHRIVIDEAHKIRNPSSQIAVYARRLSSHTHPIRWAVTGTPIVNSWKDVISLLAFIGVPYSPLWEWEQRYTQMLPDIVLHRSLDSLRHLLPSAPPVPIVHHLSLPFASPKERELYFAIQGNVIAQATGSSTATAASLDALTPQQAFLMLLRLRQLSVHPQLYISAKRRESPNYLRKDWTGPSTKLLAIRDILLHDFSVQEQQQQQQEQEHKQLNNGNKTLEKQEEPHRYLLFCQFIEEMEILQDYLLTLGFFSQDDILQYHGSLSAVERNDVLRRSKMSCRPTVMLLQLQAGGVGLNLQEYDRILFVSPWWTSALTDQAIARAVRMGQTRVVHIHHLHLEIETEDESVLLIDTLVYGKAQEKREMLETFFHVVHRTLLPQEEEEEEVLEV
jgi:SNF2 family DNA or RNA helicase